MTDPDPFGQAVREIGRAFEEAERKASRHAEVVHLGGVPWHEAPAPPRGHGHWAQTAGYLSGGMAVERCPCGAIRRPAEPWVLLDAPRVATRRPWWRRWGRT